MSQALPADAPQTIVHHLAQVPIFRGLTDEMLIQVAGVSETIHYPAGQVIFREGEIGDSLFVILNGFVKVAKTDEESRMETILSRLAAGDFFGEMSLFDAEPRSATITTLEDTEVLRLDKKHFFDLVTQNAQMCINMITFLGQRLRRANLNFKELEHIMHDIQRMLDTITKIAKQSKMLALNASIESARSGVAGKSFSVVAGEMRALAEKSQMAVIEISELITAIREKVGQIAD